MFLILVILIGCLTVSGCGYDIPTDGLVAYYPFNGNANDESGNGNHGTAHGAALTTDRNGISGSAYSFDGADDYIDLGASFYNTNDAFTVSAWASTKALGNTWSRIVDVADNGNGFFISLDGTEGNRLTGSFWDESHSYYGLEGQGAPSTDRWYHVCLTFDGSNAKFFVDGELRSEKAAAYWIRSGTHNMVGAFGFKNGNTGDYDLWKGRIDDVVFYNRALAESEIDALYKANRHPID